MPVFRPKGRVPYASVKIIDKELGILEKLGVIEKLIFFFTYTVGAAVGQLHLYMYRKTN